MTDYTGFAPSAARRDTVVRAIASFGTAATILLGGSALATAPAGHSLPAADAASTATTQSADVAQR